MAQANRTKMKLPNALFEFSVKNGEVGNKSVTSSQPLSLSIRSSSSHFSCDAGKR